MNWKPNFRKSKTTIMPTKRRAITPMTISCFIFNFWERHSPIMKFIEIAHKAHRNQKKPPEVKEE